MNINMSICKGFQLEKPECFIAWDMTPEDVAALPVSLEQITATYLVFPGSALNGLPLKVGLHFRRNGIFQIELMRADGDISQSYPLFQRHLEDVFGNPIKSLPADGGYQYFEWSFGNIVVTHSAIERFSLAEQVLITNNGGR